jgi:F0F1-type ATP synthase membrane subunit b/b'
MIRPSHIPGQFLGKLTALSCLFLLLSASPAFAQESAPSPADSPLGWIFRWVNFAIVLGLLIYGFGKGVPYFRSHAQEISQKIAEGTRAREAAEKQRREVQAKLAGIGQDISEMRAEAKRATDAEAERLRTLARSEADAIERAARAEIAAAERASLLELKALAARLAIERATAQLEKELTSKTEAALFGVFVAELGRSAN